MVGAGWAGAAVTAGATRRDGKDGLCVFTAGWDAGAVSLAGALAAGAGAGTGAATTAGGAGGAAAAAAAAACSAAKGVSALACSGSAGSVAVIAVGSGWVTAGSGAGAGADSKPGSGAVTSGWAAGCVLRPVTVPIAIAKPNRAKAITMMKAANETLTWRVSVSGVGPSNFMLKMISGKGLMIGCADSNVS